MVSATSSAPDGGAQRDSFRDYGNNEALLKAANSLIGQIEHLAAGQPSSAALWRDLLARCDALRTRLPTPATPSELARAAEEEIERQIDRMEAGQSMLGALREAIGKAESARDLRPDRFESPTLWGEYLQGLAASTVANLRKVEEDLTSEPLAPKPTR